MATIRDSRSQWSERIDTIEQGLGSQRFHADLWEMELRIARRLHWHLFAYFAIQTAFQGAATALLYALN
jgi:hypothetical protein